ncbi:MAG: SH3 domain-containing protein [Clostridiales bacterium]|nr:SH3 domain-containing protein [Clostridiales bacterium]
MKRILILTLLVLIVFSACAAPIESHSPNNTNTDTNVTDEQVKSNEGKGTSAPIVTIVPTEAPTPTPVPTPYPEELVENASGYGFTYEESNPLYIEPNINGVVLSELVAECNLLITGEVDDFYRVEANGIVGFIPKKSVATSNGYINATEVKLRKGAGTSTDIVKVTEANTELVILEKTGTWYSVVLKDTEHSVGYMHSDYVSYIEGYVVNDGVNVRESPDENSKKVTQFSRGRCVSLLSEYNGWYKIETPEHVGYISSKFIQEAPIITKLERQRAYITETGVHVREGASTGFAVLDKLHKYSPIYITGEADEWYRIEYTNDKEEKVEAFIVKVFVELGKPTVYVTGQDVNLRSGPGTGYDLLTKVRLNSEFIITGRVDDWYKGEICGNVGYILGDYLDTKPTGNGKTDKEFSDDEVYLAAKVVYLEAKGKGSDAYRAVANVIYNRVKSRKFPDSISDVVFQRSQFSVTNHSNFKSIKPTTQALNATREVLNGGLRPLPFNVLFFHATYLGTNWGGDKDLYKIIGGNAFFRYVG